MVFLLLRRGNNTGVVVFNPYSEKCGSFQLQVFVRPSRLRAGGADGSRGCLCPPMQAPALGASMAGHCGSAAHPPQPQQLSGAFSAVLELMSFPSWQTASALLRLRYVTRRWGWVGARQGEQRGAQESECLLGPRTLFTFSASLRKAACPDGGARGPARGNARSKTLTFKSRLLQTLVWTMLLQDAFPFGS